MAENLMKKIPLELFKLDAFLLALNSLSLSLSLSLSPL
jgi:hypothetical protein